MMAPDCVVVGEADNVDTAYELITQHNPHLVFLDIQMPKGNGFTLLKRYEKIDFEIIFVTSYDQYAIDAIRFNALDYLLKPVDLDLFQAAVDKARLNIRNKASKELKILNLIDTLENEDQDNQKIVVHQKDQVLLLKISEIVYLEGDINYTHVHTETSTYVLSKTLKEFEDYLHEMSSMVRIHRKYIVNTSFVRSYTKSDPFTITLSTGIELEASRRKKSDLLAGIKRMTGK
jgi:two-component system LytT family response regulator